MGRVAVERRPCEECVLVRTRYVCPRCDRRICRTCAPEHWDSGDKGSRERCGPSAEEVTALRRACFVAGGSYPVLARDLGLTRSQVRDRLRELGLSGTMAVAREALARRYRLPPRGSAA